MALQLHAVLGPLLGQVHPGLHAISLQSHAGLGVLGPHVHHPLLVGLGLLGLLALFLALLLHLPLQLALGGLLGVGLRGDPGLGLAHQLDGLHLGDVLRVRALALGFLLLLHLLLQALGERLDQIHHLLERVVPLLDPGLLVLVLLHELDVLLDVLCQVAHARDLVLGRHAALLLGLLDDQRQALEHGVDVLDVVHAGLEFDRETHHQRASGQLGVMHRVGDFLRLVGHQKIGHARVVGGGKGGHP